MERKIGRKGESKRVITRYHKKSKGGEWFVDEFHKTKTAVIEGEKIPCVIWNGGDYEIRVSS